MSHLIAPHPDWRWRQPQAETHGDATPAPVFRLLPNVYRLGPHPERQLLERVPLGVTTLSLPVVAPVSTLVLISKFEATVKRNWNVAKAWLGRELRRAQDPKA